MAYKDKLPILKNFVEMGITQDVSSVDTTIYVSNASLFPAVVPGADYIPCVIRWSGSTREVVHITAVNTSANTITVERGKEGTAAQSWPIGSFIYATLTAQAQTDILNNIWIRCRQSNGNAVAVTVESVTSFSLPGDWTDALEPMMALRILANGAFLSTENGIYINSVSYTASTGKTLVAIRGTSLPAKVATVEHSLSSRAISQSKEVQAYRDLVERVSANLNESERICIEKAQIAQAAADRLTLSSAVDSTKEDCAATPLGVKKAYDRGSAGINAAGAAQSAAATAQSTANNALNVANGKAPGGYGLGVNAGRSVHDANNALESGWWNPDNNQNALNFYDLNHPLLVLARGFWGTVQIQFVHGRIAVRELNDSKWEPWALASVGYAVGAGYATRLRREGGVDTIWNWAGQAGQPSWLWGSNDGTNMYVYNPSNFNVNYANSANYANSTNYANSAGSAPANGGTAWATVTVPNIVGTGTLPAGGTWRCVYENSDGGGHWMQSLAGGSSFVRIYASQGKPGRSPLFAIRIQ